MVPLGSVSDSESEGRGWGICNVLFLHLDDGYTVIHFIKYIEMYSYNLCLFNNILKHNKWFLI